MTAKIAFNQFPSQYRNILVQLDILFAERYDASWWRYMDRNLLLEFCKEYAAYPNKRFIHSIGDIPFKFGKDITILQEVYKKLANAVNDVWMGV